MTNKTQDLAREVREAVIREANANAADIDETQEGMMTLEGIAISEARARGVSISTPEGLKFVDGVMKCLKIEPSRVQDLTAPDLRDAAVQVLFTNADALSMRVLRAAVDGTPAPEKSPT